MIGLGLIFGFVVLTFVAVLAWRERHWRRELAGEQRRGADLLAEKQTECDTSVTATFVRVRDEFLAEPSMTVTDVNVPEATIKLAARSPAEIFASVESRLPKAPQDLIQWFRERVGMLNAATQHANQTIQNASATVDAVNAENTLHRQLLERALALPLDTPEAHRQLFLIRCRSVLSSPRATADCPSEAFWQEYVATHAKLAKDGVTT